MSHRKKSTAPPAVPAPTSAPAPVSPLPEILTLEEAAALLKVKPTVLYSWTRRRSSVPIPFKHLGKFLRFEKQELLQFFSSLGSETKVGYPFGRSRKVSS